MSHDPLCPSTCEFDSHYAKGLPSVCRGGDCTRCDEVDCCCELISKVRADERAACMAAVESMVIETVGNSAATVDQVLAALQEVQP